MPQQGHCRLGQGGRITERHCAGRLQLRQQLADTTVIPAQHRAPHRKRLDYRAPERLRLVRDLQY
ncbi:hypothetical protein D3C81_1791090 [compost metagenome]